MPEERISKEGCVIITLILCYLVIPELAILTIPGELESVGILFMFSTPMILLFAILSTRYYHLYEKIESRYYRSILIVFNAILVLVLGMGCTLLLMNII